MKGQADRLGKRRRPVVFVSAVTVAALVAACAGTTTPSSTASSAAPAPVTSTPTPIPSVTASPTIAPPSATASASSSPPAAPSPSSSSEACAVERQTGVLPSDRFTSVVITTGPDADVVTFAFGRSSLPGPPAPPAGSLETAVPPFTEAASGEPIGLAGEHALQVRFTNMSLQNDVGQPTYEGDPEYRPGGQALRDLVLFDMSEGVVGWYIGYDGSGCVTLATVGDSVTVRIAHD